MRNYSGVSQPAIIGNTAIFHPRADVSRGFCLLDSAWTAGLFLLYSRTVRAFSPENRQECYIEGSL